MRGFGYRNIGHPASNGVCLIWVLLVATPKHPQTKKRRLRHDDDHNVDHLVFLIVQPWRHSPPRIIASSSASCCLTISTHYLCRKRPRSLFCALHNRVCYEIIMIAMVPWSILLYEGVIDWSCVGRWCDSCVGPMIDRSSVVGVIHALDRRNNYATIDFFPEVITTKQQWFWRRHQDVSSSNFTKHEGYTLCNK